MITPEQAYANAHNAINWLEANPDQHITGLMAMTEEGEWADGPLDPTASCFCAVGRMIFEAKQAGLTKRGGCPYRDLARRVLSPLGLEADTLTGINDVGLRHARSLHEDHGYELDTSPVITRLRETIDKAFLEDQPA